VIPQTRGGSRSIALEAILKSVRAFVAGGGQELVLSGINLGRWGRDLAQPRRFDELVAAILTETELPRLRISSVEPMDWSEQLLERFAAFSQGEHPRLARHAHLPLQSGSDAVLRAMYRRYRPWHYAAKLEQISKKVPDAAIGADVMVGFPGETDALFAETLRFIEERPFTYLHLFPFSARPGTAAWELHQRAPVHGEAVKERLAALRTLIDAKNKAFRERFVGRGLSVVTLQRGKDASRTAAMADNFLSVTVAGQFPANLLLRVRITGLSESGLYGEEVAAGRPD
jgi:threonylcarbamoyladenosine tRNA methylthiotransferase MtaB